MKRLSAGMALGVLLMLSGCGLVGGETAPTGTPTASPALGPTPTPEYLDGLDASEIEDIEANAPVTSVPEDFPRDMLMDGAKNVSAEETMLYTEVDYVVEKSASAARAFYEEKGAKWENVQRLTGNGEWTMRGEDGQVSLAVTVSDYLENATMVKVVVFYQRDIEEAPGADGTEGPTNAPADEGADAGAEATPGDANATPEPDAEAE